MNDAVFDTFPTLETPRLILRGLQEEDAEAVRKMRSNARVGAFIARLPEISLEESKQLIVRTQQMFHDKKAIAWAGQIKESGQFIGSCGLMNIEWENQHAEIGGEMWLDFWGKGYSQEGVMAILNFGIHQLKLHTIEAKVDHRNRSAIALLEKAGFVREALFRERIRIGNQFTDMAIYTLFS